MYDSGVTEREMDGGRTTLKLDDSAVVGEPVTITLAFIFTSFCVWDIWAVVHVTLVVPSENDFEVPSSVVNPEGGSMRLTDPEPDRPETSTVNERPFMTVPVSAPDCEIVTDAAYVIAGTMSRSSRMLDVNAVIVFVFIMNTPQYA